MVVLGGWRTLYAGFSSLLTRQVIFGSIKFFAFEQVCQAIYGEFPHLREETLTSLAVSLVAGGIAGSISSIVSQPADSVLTYAAQNPAAMSTPMTTTKGENNDFVDRIGLLCAARCLMEEEDEGGIGALFRGWGSRCVWAGCIIAGQFLLYDVFRTFFGVSGEDLVQVYRVVIAPSMTAAASPTILF